MWRITLRELKDRKWSLFIYCLGSFLLLWTYAATFTSSQNSTQQLQELIKSYPKGLLDALGLNNLNINTIEIYLNAKHFSLLWPLLAITLALSRAANHIAGEVQTGTMGLLLALPVKRTQIFIAKYAAGLVSILLFTTISIFGIIPLAALYNVPTHIHVLASAWLLISLFMMSIYALGMALSSGAREKGTVYAIVGGSLVVLYVANILSLIVTNLHWLRYISPFYYFNTGQVLLDGTIALSSIVVFSTTILASTAYACWRFCTRDVSV